LLQHSDIKNRLKDAHYLIDTLEDGNISIRAFLENKDKNINTIGWFIFDIKRFRLYEELIVEPDKFIEIGYDNSWKDVISTLYLNKSKKCIKVKKKSWLYRDKRSKSKKFLIKDDVALILKKKKGWYKIYFHHPKFHTSTILWIKSKDTEEIK